LLIQVKESEGVWEVAYQLSPKGWRNEADKEEKARVKTEKELGKMVDC
jgi:hypothetical protein